MCIQLPSRHVDTWISIWQDRTTAVLCAVLQAWASSRHSGCCSPCAAAASSGASLSPPMHLDSFLPRHLPLLPSRRRVSSRRPATLAAAQESGKIGQALAASCCHANRHGRRCLSSWRPRLTGPLAAVAAMAVPHSQLRLPRQHTSRQPFQPSSSLACCGLCWILPVLRGWRGSSHATSQRCLWLICECWLAWPSSGAILVSPETWPGLPATASHRYWLTLTWPALP